MRKTEPNQTDIMYNESMRPNDFLKRFGLRLSQHEDYEPKPKGWNRPRTIDGKLKMDAPSMHSSHPMYRLPFTTAPEAISPKNTGKDGVYRVILGRRIEPVPATFHAPKKDMDEYRKTIGRSRQV